MRKQMLAGVAAVAVVAVGLVILRRQDASSRSSGQAGSRQGLVEQDGAGGAGAAAGAGQTPAARGEAESAAAAIPVDAADAALELVSDGAAEYLQRQDAVAGLGSHLTPPQRERVVELIQDAQIHPTLRNDLLEALARQDEPYPELGSLLLDIWRDEQQGAIFRNYALQHMEHAHLQGAQREEVQRVLVEVAGGTSEDAGTALLSLQRIGESDPAVAAQARELAQQALARAQEDPQTAVVGMQMAAEAGDRSVLVQARQTAATKGTHTRLRMSAIYALGQLGESEDIQLLKTLTADPNYRVREAAGTNLKKLQQRLNGQS